MRYRTFSSSLLTVLSLAAIVPFAAFASRASLAATLDYTMHWNSVSGTYGGNSFSAQPLTIQFLNVDAANVFSYNPPTNSVYYTNFVNGENIRVTLGSILVNASLDNLASNGSSLAATASQVFFGTISAGTYGTDRGFLSSFSVNPSAANKLTTEWVATASNGQISNAFSNAPLTINGQILSLPVSFNTAGGSWNSVASVPEPSSMAIAGLGVVAVGLARGIRGGRRFWRKKHNR